MKLHEFIAAHLETRFAWGQHDCVHFSAAWVREATGRDPLEGLPRWRSERGALRVIRMAGGLQAGLDARFSRIHPSEATDGCLALYQGAVCLFSGSYIVGPNRDGMMFIDRTEAECAWSY